VVTGAARSVALLVVALAILPFLPALGGQFLNWDDNISFLAKPGFRGLGWAQLRQEAIEAWAAMSTAKPPVEIPGRDRKTVRP
jgi:hypothetical protein